MASNGCTMEGGHDSLCEYQCYLCEEEGQQMEATKFCKECFVYMCELCVQTKHNRFPLNKRHQMLAQTQFSTVKESSLRSFPTKRCPKHPGELINIYCSEHDVTCCLVCKTLEHGNCVKSQHLFDAAKGIHIKSKECQRIIQETEMFLSEVKKVLNDGKAEMTRIAEAKEQVKSQIADFRKKVDKFFDDLEMKSLDELQELESKIISDIERGVKHLDDTRSEAEEILQQLQSYKGDNECELFVQVKDGKRLLSDARGSLQKISRSVNKESIYYVVDPKIEEFLNSIETLGSFTDKPTAITRHTENPVDTKTYPVQSLELEATQGLDYACDMCVLGDNTLILSSQNYMIAFDKSNRHIDTLQILGTPVSIFAVGDGRAAVLYNEQIEEVSDSDKPVSICAVTERCVAVLFEDKIEIKSVAGSNFPNGARRYNNVDLQLHDITTVNIGNVGFVTVGKKLVMQSIFSLESSASGMVYNDGMLYVCQAKSRYPFVKGKLKDERDGFHIAVYSEDGQLQRYIPHPPLYFDTKPQNIIVSDDGTILFTYVQGSDISLLDMSGNAVNSFDSISLSRKQGPCTDGRGQLFVCTSNNEVIRLSLKNQNREVILSEADGKTTPLAVCFDRKRCRLLVLCCERNDQGGTTKFTVLVYNLAQSTC